MEYPLHGYSLSEGREKEGMCRSGETPRTWGAWTPVSYYSAREYPTADAARIAAEHAVPWLSSILDR
jgi:hypothetical protein